ncbi:lactosylceramide 1,3-N-acetyl-beta-D-glucosaminyltransferase-like isoform X2 [Haliotis cracherodii]|uniref:lactosylceramide 1,3-N-acetyl-beta-D-glucosaminyltransferase-like isoform X2 n=1 Tax=Haliotis cracherodii TaxID=6455 RepID=UPI0039EBBCA7
MGRIRFSTYLRIKQVLVTCVTAICVVTVLMATGFTSHTTFTKRRYHMTELSDYVSKQFPFGGNELTALNTSEYTSQPVATSTKSPVMKDTFRDFFDLRPVVHPFRTSQKHPFLPDIVLSNDICNGSKVDILIYFNSACDNFQRRRILRETWANRNVFKDITVRAIFILGLPSKRDTQLRLNNENTVYGDLVQGDFTDSFRNLTYKALTAIKWINDNCAQARYVIKSDDDMFVNMFMVVEDFLPMICKKQRTVVCHYKKHGTSVIIRNPKDKWYVPPDVLPDKTTFPDFCSGYVVIMTTDSIPLLYESSFQAPLISIDDVYMFGVLPLFSRKLNYVDGSKYFTLNNKVALEQYKSTKPITYIVANAWQDGSQETYWASTINRLSLWAKRHASIVVLRNSMGPK